MVAAFGKQWGLVSPQRITEGITHRQMAKLLKEAAEKAEALMQANLIRSGVGATVTAAQMRVATEGISALSTELWTGTGKITRAGMYQSAALAADQALDLDLFMGMPGLGLLQYADNVHFEAAQVVEDLISRRTTGFALSERIYAHGKQTTKEVGRIVERNLALQRSARDIAAEVKKHYRPDVPGGTSYAAMRLGRTEINNAHHETTKRLAGTRPWVRGMKWNKSSSHPRPDICDQYAEHNEGLGTGGWKDPPSKPHPQCLCYLTHMTVDEDEFMDKLANGQYDNYLTERGVVC
jgi:hypothetical protein